MFENVPRHVKLMFLIGVLAIGPMIAIAAFLGGFNAAMFTAAAIFILGMISYLVTIRKYTKNE